jgi:hypothetical protein
MQLKVLEIQKMNFKIKLEIPKKKGGGLKLKWKAPFEINNTPNIWGFYHVV